MILADQIRTVAKKEYVSPAVTSGQSTFSISIKELMQKAEQQGISTMQRTPAFCAAIRTQTFLDENSLEITSQVGPASKKSTTLVINYRIDRKDAPVAMAASETPEQRAFRLTEKLRGLMKDEIAAHGGADGYLRWVRGEDEEEGE